MTLAEMEACARRLSDPLVIGLVLAFGVAIDVVLVAFIVRLLS